MRTLFCLTVFALAAHPAAAQMFQPDPARADSIRQVIARAPDDTTRLRAWSDLKYVVSRAEREAVVVEAFNQYCTYLHANSLKNKAFTTSTLSEQLLVSPLRLYGIRGQTAQTLAYAKQALECARQIGDPNFDLYFKNELLGAYYEAALLDSALLVAQGVSERELAAATPTVQMEWAAHLHKFYQAQGDLTRATQWGYRLLQTARGAGSAEYTAVANYELAKDFLLLKDYPKALELIRDGLQSSGKDPDLRIKAFDFHDLAVNVWLAKGDFEQARQSADQALAVAQSLGMANVQVHAHALEASIDWQMRNYPAATQRLQAVVDSVDWSSIRPNIQCKTLTILAAAYLAEGRLAAAQTTAAQLEKAVELADQILLQTNAHRTLSDVYEQSQRPADALRHFKIWTVLHDSLNSRDNQQALIRQQLQLDFDRQELARTQTRNALVGGAVVLALLVLFLWQRNRLKQRTNRELAAKNAQIEVEKARAEASERFKGRFLAQMSHEIRTPMNAIFGMSELLHDTPLDLRQRRYVEAIRASADNLLVVVNDVLDFSKLEAGKMVLETVPFRVLDLVGQTEQTLRYRAEEKGLAFHCSVGAAVPAELLGDPARLQQVLLNLAGNALKFTESGSVWVSVEPAPPPFFAAPPHWRFKVKDTGIGIPPEQLEHIFEQFSQADSSISRRYGGTGLGLTIAQQILALYNSRLQVESTPGVGSTFFFDLELAVPELAGWVYAHPEETPPNYDALAGLRVLVAEDNAYNQMVVTETLEKWIPDVALTVVKNGREVLEALETGAFDLILMDVQMPELDGYAATRQIRQPGPNAGQHNIPILALTASTTQEEIADSWAAGVNGVVRKPFRADNLLAEMLRVTGRAGVVGQTSLREFTTGDPTEMARWQARFRTSAPLELGRLQSAVTDRRAADFRKIAHSFRPSLELVGLGKLATQLLQLEQQVATNPDWSAVNTDFEAFTTRLTPHLSD